MSPYLKMDQKTVRKRIEGLADEDYRLFQSKLVPGEEKILGVRVPALRKLAKDLMKEADAGDLLGITGTSAYEERMIRGMYICLDRKAGMQTLFRRIGGYVPLIDNWCICDTFCAGLGQVRRYRKETWELLQPYLKDERTYFRRFGLVMMLDHFLDGEYMDMVLERACMDAPEDYYIMTARAWLISMCYVSDFQRTEDFITAHPVDDRTMRTAVRKTIESRRADEAMREYMREKRRTLSRG